MRDAPEVLRRAAIYVLQLADRDISPMLGEELLRAIEQDGYTLAARSEPPKTWEERLGRMLALDPEAFDLISAEGYRLGNQAARSEAEVDVTIGPIQHSNSQCQKEGCDCWCQACERHNWRHARSETEPKP